ncbi:MFS transporter [Microbacterium sp. HD4P20]|uniref:MFS transporter n=1 Tax=Microbacterium sp. HD4P20 TaxID=2864874 RepID=UPI001C643FC3|nr:MFS transporter [Microbacterium sp. HD4P20]MCP2636490.1 MFS transporter [Microbacterium sp. HD4P20]
MPAAEPRGGASFTRYWVAATISSFGTAITAVAMPVLVVQVLGASPIEVGIANAAQFVPYAVLGLLAGVYVDRWRRVRVLVWSSVGRGLALGLIPVLWFAGVLEIWSLVLLLLLFGSFAVFGFAASQSLLPQVVPRSRLLGANSRLDQSDAAAQTAGPALGGGLVGLLGAPLTIAIDAVSYLVEAVLVARLRLTKPLRTAGTGEPSPQRRSVRREVAEGLRWTYRHVSLAPLAISTHVWFFANAGALTVLALFVLRDLDLSPATFGLLFAVAGITTLVGAAVAPWAGRVIGAGRSIVITRAVYPVAWLVIALAAITDAGGSGALVALFVAMALQGFVAGLENPNEMAYRQAVTPDALLGRTSATIRSANRSMAALGALAAGLAVGVAGIAPALVGVVVVFVAAAAVAAASPLRHARHEDGEGS